MDEQECRVQCLRAAVDLVAPGLAAADAATLHLASARRRGRAAGDQVLTPEAFASVFEIAARFEAWVRNGKSADESPLVRGDFGAGEIEVDEAFRRRIQMTAGNGTLHQTRIERDTGALLDEIGGFYGLERRRG